ncbi:hypothetical protein GNI_038240 [Gregarina niphandrodes]|uniref:Uncharacterized protein n=1 Tax=Gregarina niphandrodes TaxID=110365 RepID=A0A023BAK5_GRENI|nr:hypothetical protein GNI_038240 [Gregarina niphandrodes]EZG78314.1 hypothetical protein GNI_038240 [Gregarina niphandrodes]|eukprot:XP_011129352.1 hypothetical protein GNI_038240 [Gregarina niphandrodes]
METELSAVLDWSKLTEPRFLMAGTECDYVVSEENTVDAWRACLEACQKGDKLPETCHSGDQWPSDIPTFTRRQIAGVNVVLGEALEDVGINECAIELKQRDEKWVWLNWDPSTRLCRLLTEDDAMFVFTNAYESLPADYCNPSFEQVCSNQPYNCNACQTEEQVCVWIDNDAWSAGRTGGRDDMAKFEQWCNTAISTGVDCQWLTALTSVDDLIDCEPACAAGTLDKSDKCVKDGRSSPADDPALKNWVFGNYENGAQNYVSPKSCLRQATKAAVYALALTSSGTCQTFSEDALLPIFAMDPTAQKKPSGCDVDTYNKYCADNPAACDLCGDGIPRCIWAEPAAFGGMATRQATEELLDKLCTASAPAQCDVVSVKTPSEAALVACKEACEGKVDPPPDGCAYDASHLGGYLFGANGITDGNDGLVDYTWVEATGIYDCTLQAYQNPDVGYFAWIASKTACGMLSRSDTTRYINTPVSLLEEAECAVSSGGKGLEYCRNNTCIYLLRAEDDIQDLFSGLTTTDYLCSADLCAWVSVFNQGSGEALDNCYNSCKSSETVSGNCIFDGRKPRDLATDPNGSDQRSAITNWSLDFKDASTIQISDNAIPVSNTTNVTLYQCQQFFWTVDDAAWWQWDSTTKDCHVLPDQLFRYYLSNVLDEVSKETCDTETALKSCDSGQCDICNSGANYCASYSPEIIYGGGKSETELWTAVDGSCLDCSWIGLNGDEDPDKFDTCVTQCQNNDQLSEECIKNGRDTVYIPLLVGGKNSTRVRALPDAKSHLDCVGLYKDGSMALTMWFSDDQSCMGVTSDDLNYFITTPIADLAADECSYSSECAVSAVSAVNSVLKDKPSSRDVESCETVCDDRCIWISDGVQVATGGYAKDVLLKAIEGLCQQNQCEWTGYEPNDDWDGLNDCHTTCLSAGTAVDSPCLMDGRPTVYRDIVFGGPKSSRVKEFPLDDPKEPWQCLNQTYSQNYYFTWQDGHCYGLPLEGLKYFVQTPLSFLKEGDCDIEAMGSADGLDVCDDGIPRCYWTDASVVSGGKSVWDLIPTFCTAGVESLCSWTGMSTLDWTQLQECHQQCLVGDGTLGGNTDCLLDGRGLPAETPAYSNWVFGGQPRAPTSLTKTRSRKADRTPHDLSTNTVVSSPWDCIAQGAAADQLFMTATETETGAQTDTIVCSLRTIDQLSELIRSPLHRLGAMCDFEAYNRACPDGAGTAGCDICGDQVARCVWTQTGVWSSNYDPLRTSIRDLCDQGLDPTYCDWTCLERVAPKRPDVVWTREVEVDEVLMTEEDWTALVAYHSSCVAGALLPSKETTDCESCLADGRVQPSVDKPVFRPVIFAGPGSTLLSERQGAGSSPWTCLLSLRETGDVLMTWDVAAKKCWSMSLESLQRLLSTPRLVLPTTECAMPEDVTSFDLCDDGHDWCVWTSDQVLTGSTLDLWDLLVPSFCRRAVDPVACDAVGMLSEGSKDALEACHDDCLNAAETWSSPFCYSDGKTQPDRDNPIYGNVVVAGPNSKNVLKPTFAITTQWDCVDWMLNTDMQGTRYFMWTAGSGSTDGQSDGGPLCFGLTKDVVAYYLKTSLAALQEDECDWEAYDAACRQSTTDPAPNCDICDLCHGCRRQRHW